MKQHAPAAMRNRGPLLEQLRRRLPSQRPCDVLEIASGTGTHAAYFVASLPQLRWHPTDVSVEALASIDAYRAEVDRDRLVAPRRFDVCEPGHWSGQYDAVFCANMVHIAPWAAGEALMRNAGSVLQPEGNLLLYGPFCFAGAFTAESNAAFDASLRTRDPSWGVRDVEALKEVADGLSLVETVEMPANNHLLVWRKDG